MIRPDLPAPPLESAPGAPVRRAPRWARRGLVATGTLVALTLAGFTAVGIVRQVLRASLPRLEGSLAIAGLSAPVSVERDALGIPTIAAADPLDAARALGFLHGQERFFQMDLARRRASGELSALLGAAALHADRESRVHRFRARAGATLAAATTEERATLLAYAEGVNAGLAALGGRPFEYLALRADPVAWRPEDTVLVVDSMALLLQDDRGRRESDLALLYATLPAPLADFLVPRGTPWDAPLAGPAFAPPEIPGPAVIDFRAPGVPRPAPSARATRRSPTGPPPERPTGGSNNWAVAGGRTAGGGALLAGDMHLPLGVPATWYRATLRWPHRGGGPGEVKVTGVTLPGVPGVVAGSNGHVAWAFTNSYVDTGDLVLLDEVGADRYLAPDGPREFERFTERIEVKGGEPATLEVRETIWGPVVDAGPDGRPRAFRWAAHAPDAVDLGLFQMAEVHTLDAALALATRCGMPAQNAVFADDAGRIGWTILGRVPRRVGFDGRLPSSWADGTRRWDGWLPPEEWPRIVDPPAGVLWTANARVVGGDALARLGDGGYDLGARAAQIRDRLLALEGADEGALLALQLDDRALLLAPWRELLLEALRPEAIASDPKRAEARRLIDGWGGRASIDSAGYRIVRSFRLNFARQAFRPLVAPCEKADPAFSLFAFPQWEGPLWQLVRKRPAHLLDPRFSSWNNAILSALDATLFELTADGEALAEQTWGKRNTVVLRHPLSGAIPFAGAWLDLPAVALPGDVDMPRVQGQGFGASQRMVVSPGREAAGLFHLPGGQSGHPLSVHYGDQQEAWARGAPAPFLPGPAVHRLELVPAPSAAPPPAPRPMPPSPAPIVALAALCLAGALATGGYVVALARRLRYLRDEAPAAGDRLPALTVVLAARDEQARIEHAVRSLLAQDYPGLRIVAVDDRSSDGTGAILDRLAAEDPRLDVVHLAALPAGWLGKSHALEVGASHAAGEYLLFTDGDVVFEPLALRRAVARAGRGRLDHLAVVPEIRARGALLRATVAAFSFYFALAIPPWRVRSRRRPDAIGIGAFNLVRADAYRAAGGHAAFPLRPDDDLALARALKRAGARSAVLSGLGELSVEWYPSLTALVDGLQKNIFSGFDFRTGRALLAAAAMTVGHVLPFAAPFVTPSPARWLFAAAALLLALQVGLAARGAGLPWRSGLLFPAASLVWVMIVARGTLVPLARGEIEWRGTRYPLAELRRAHEGRAGVEPEG